MITQKYQFWWMGAGVVSLPAWNAILSYPATHRTHDFYPVGYGAAG